MNKLIERLKKSWLSITIWFNSLCLVLWDYVPEALNTIPMLREYVAIDVYKWLMLIVIIGNMILRVKTTQDLANKGK